jgi:hypothetical protein
MKMKALKLNISGLFRKIIMNKQYLEPLTKQELDY